jgi:transcriptional regulator with XRE-family HTH domain
MSGNRDNRIAELLLRADLSVAEAADFCGVTSRTVERWIREEVAIPDDQKRRLADRLEVSVEYLLGWDRTPATTAGGAS